MRSVKLRFLCGRSLYREVVVRGIARARESVWIATANVKELYLSDDPAGGRRQRLSILELFARLARRGVDLRLLHAALPSRVFRASFERQPALAAGALALKQCPRVHLKAVLIDGGRLYLGSANLTGAGLGARSERRRNFEVGFLTEDFELIDHLSALFDSIWSGQACRECGRVEVCPDPIRPR